MWMLVAILLVAVPGSPDTEILKILHTKGECEAYKAGALERFVEVYRVPYPLNFKLECREVKP